MQSAGSGHALVLKTLIAEAGTRLCKQLHHLREVPLFSQSANSLLSAARWRLSLPQNVSDQCAISMSSRIAVSLTFGRALYAELILEERLLALTLSIDRIHMTTHKGMDTMPAAVVALMNID